MKTALVAGASRGIGLAIARELGTNGYHVAVMAIHDEAFYPESTEIPLEAGISYTQCVGDIGKSGDRSRVVRGAAEKFGEIHVPVDNAGVVLKVRADLLEMTEESFDYVAGTNTKGNTFMTQAATRQMMKQPVYGGRRGTVINISSCSSRVSPVNRGKYCASKAGISMLTKLFTDRLALEGVPVYEIRPGVIHTDVTSQMEEKYMELIRQGMLPIAKWGVPENVAKAVRIFCSDDFCYMIGNYIDVDGRFRIQHLQDVVPAHGY